MVGPRQGRRHRESLPLLQPRVSFSQRRTRPPLPHRQAEDSDGDIGELWFSIKTVMKLTGEQLELVRKNVIIVRDKTNRGDAFIAAMRGHIARHKPDFV